MSDRLLFSLLSSLELDSEEEILEMRMGENCVGRGWISHRQ